MVLVLSTIDPPGSTRGGKSSPDFRMLMHEYHHAGLRVNDTDGRKVRRDCGGQHR
jgi:hypothetical protein